MTPQSYGYWIGFRRVDDACIPKGWRMAQLRDLAKFRAGGTLGLTMSDYVSDGVDAYSAEGLNGKAAVKEFSGPAVIVSSIGARCGKCFFAASDFTTLANIQVIFPDAEKLDAKFLWNVINRESFWDRYATAQPFIRPSEIKKSWVPVPPLDEQAAIAHVLDAVDAAIDRARKAVEQAQAMRLSLMQAAFHYEMTSEPKHDTDAGRIPQSWQALKGKQMFSVLTGGNSSVSAIKPLRGDDKADAWFMKVDDFNLPANARRIVTTQIGFVASKNPSFKLLPLGTIVIAKRGAAILKNRVRTTVVPVALDPNLMALKMREDILPEFFRYQLEWRNLSRYIESSGVPQLNNKDLYPRWFVCAPEGQQKEIVAIISAAEQKEDALHDKLLALETLKQSLMHDLLTGTVRVDPALFQKDATS